MATLQSSKAAGKVRRLVDHFVKRPTSVSYANWGHPTLMLGFDAPKDADGDYKDVNARDFRLSLDQADITAVLNAMLNPNYSMGYFMEGRSQKTDLLYGPALEAAGIFTTRYRHEHFRLGRKAYVHVDGVNERHALWQLEKVMKGDFDAARLERLCTDANGPNRWLNAGGFLVEYEKEPGNE